MHNRLGKVILYASVFVALPNLKQQGASPSPPATSMARLVVGIGGLREGRGWQAGPAEVVGAGAVRPVVGLGQGGSNDSYDGRGGRWCRGGVSPDLRTGGDRLGGGGGGRRRKTCLPAGGRDKQGGGGKRRL
ncbi:hypothetical protein SETIT_5G362500v2 [Setaria italica]|uniref:Uncharacterized protein n=1 Tax=Setaria italica TaxID=4555 RepID=A0A368RCN8_SETIT|nr:hypothetical protein SETIT_5G362500v2 [Setaria italica]